MLEYEWGNTSPILLSPEQPSQENVQNSQILDQYPAQSFSDDAILQQNPPLFHAPVLTPLHSPYDPSVFPSQQQNLSVAGDACFLVPKAEHDPPQVTFAARIGLDLGGRTYFSSADDGFVSRLYRRSRGPNTGASSSATPRCQADGCHADLRHAKHYHRRHKVCEFHSKSSTVISAGLSQRFCQQCSRFHILSEFDNGKRSCRKRLADHNRRRRKSSNTNNESLKSPTEAICASSSQNSTGWPSSTTITTSPPSLTLDSFKERLYQPHLDPSSSSNSLFFSTG